jgi:hypothetical protein
MAIRDWCCSIECGRHTLTSVSRHLSLAGCKNKQLLSTMTQVSISKAWLAMSGSMWSGDCGTVIGSPWSYAAMRSLTQHPSLVGDAASPTKDSQGSFTHATTLLQRLQPSRKRGMPHNTVLLLQKEHFHSQCPLKHAQSRVHSWWAQG